MMKDFSFFLPGKRLPSLERRVRRGTSGWALTLSALALGGVLQGAPARAADVLTYHVDTQRTGWNNQETVLKASNVNSSTFGVLHSIALDDQVDAQPLVVGSLSIAGGTHEVVYVATENNTVYALDANTGAQLVTPRHLATPVPRSTLPGQCNNNGVNVGINSTPAIDPATKTLYVISYEYTGNKPNFVLHALNMTTLADKVPPRTITASQTLSDGTTYKFDPANTRQRAGLLKANGNIYAGFASFCDIHANLSRGWLLGWKRDSALTPLAANQLNNRHATAPHNQFLSSIWMSGYGLAADPGGNIYFVTGNSDYSGRTFDPPNNIQESTVKMKSDLTTVLDYFTPSGATEGVTKLDQGDTDFGSGGAMVIPDVSGATQMVVAAGKTGSMFLMNRGNLGQYNATGANRVLGTYSAGACWCGPSYFVAANGQRRVISSGGNGIKAWQVNASSLQPAAGGYASLKSGQDPSFFTSISSNGTIAGTAVIWAVTRPFDTTKHVFLYAYDGNSTASNTQPLFSAVAGSWPNTGGNANIVPVAANGKVFVASYKALNIFGIGGHGTPLSPEPAPPPRNPSAVEIFGRITAVADTTVTVQTASGTVITVQTTDAQAADQSTTLVVGRAVDVRGSFVGGGVLHADTILRVKDDPAFWTPQ